MRGSVVKRGNTWSYVVDVGRDPVSGRRRQRWKGGFPTKREAERALGRALAAVGAGEVADAGGLTVGAYFDQWLAGHLPSLKPSTAKSYREAVQWYVKPRLGAVKLVDLNALLIRTLYADMLTSGGRRRKPELSPATVGITHGVLRKALNDAVLWGLLVRSPLLGVKPPRLARPEMHVWSSDEARRFLSIVEGERLYGLWVLALATGMRRGELAGLRGRHRPGRERARRDGVLNPTRLRRGPNLARVASTEPTAVPRRYTKPSPPSARRVGSGGVDWFGTASTLVYRLGSVRFQFWSAQSQCEASDSAQVDDVVDLKRRAEHEIEEEIGDVGRGAYVCGGCDADGFSRHGRCCAERGACFRSCAGHKCSHVGRQRDGRVSRCAVWFGDVLADGDRKWDGTGRDWWNGLGVVGAWCEGCHVGPGRRRWFGPGVGRSRRQDRFFGECRAAGARSGFPLQAGRGDRRP